MTFTSWLAGLPGLRMLRDLRRDVLAMRWDLHATRQAMEHQLRATSASFAETLLRQPRYADPRHLAHHEAQVHSQGGEDGVLAEVFRRIGTTTRTFVEIGVESGVEANTTLLLRQGWRGWWVDADATNVAKARRRFAREIAAGQLTIIEAMVTSHNAMALLRDAGVPATIDLLSVDIDRNTWHVWRALQDLTARVTVVEYNASFGPVIDWVIDDDPTATWDGTVHFGASLAACDRLGRERGLALVGCLLNGANAVFVQSALAEPHFPGPYTSERFWEPPRYWLRWREGHPTA